MAFLKVAGISKMEGDTKVLHKVNFTQKKNQKIAIAGETGSGKSSLLKIIAGLMQADQGEVLFESEKVAGPNEKLVAGHPDIAYLSQHFELAKFLRVSQVLSYANTISQEEANGIYETCQVMHLLDRQTNQLSGGERQRIALAKLITSMPKLLLLDEPYSNLDVIHKSTLKAVITDISKRYKITCMLISHDPADVLSWADKILVLKSGRIVQQGSPQEIYNEPFNEYVAGLFGKYNLFPASLLMHLDGFDSLKNPGEPVIVRPENLTIVEEKQEGLKGKILEVIYYGSHHEVKILVLGKIVLLKAENNSHAIGDTVSVVKRRS